MSNNDVLTEKQKKFVDEYLIDLNATQAAIRAGYSEKTADVQASRLLVNVKVQEYLQQKQKELQDRTGVTQDKIIAELVKVAFGDRTNIAKIVTRPMIKRIWDDDIHNFVYTEESDATDQFVEIKDTCKFTEEEKACISCIKQTRHGIVVEFVDKLKAIELLGKRFGLWKDDLPLPTPVTINMPNPYNELTVDELKALAKKAESEGK